MIVIQPVRKINSAIVRKNIPNTFETIKNFRPKEAPKKVYIAAGSPPPPPQGDDINLKRPFTAEELSKIRCACRGNLLPKDYFANMLYSKRI